MERRKRGSTVEGWRANAIDLRLTAEDLDLLDTVLCVQPELRIAAFLGQEARKRDLAYPVETAQQLVDVLANDTFELMGHRIASETVAAALPDEWFPLAHEGEFLSAVHLALVRCRAEAAARRLRELRRDDGSPSEGG